MKKLIKILLGLIGIVLVITLATAALTDNEEDQESNFLQNFISNITNSFTNMVFDASGIKTQIEDTLYEQAGNIAAATGLSTSEITEAIGSLDIESWEITTLPSSEVVADSVSATYEGIVGTITTYESSEYVTIEILEQELTFEVPQSAQEYVALLDYLQ